MTTFEILRLLQPSDDKWIYQGQIIHNDKKISVKGTVLNYPTNSQIKKAIIADVKEKVKKYLLSFEPLKTKTLSSDSIFRDVLTS